MADESGLTEQLYNALGMVTEAYRTVLEARVGGRQLRPDETPRALGHAEATLLAVDRRMFDLRTNDREGDPDHEPFLYERTRG